MCDGLWEILEHTVVDALICVHTGESYLPASVFCVSRCHVSSQMLACDRVVSRPLFQYVKEYLPTSDSIHIRSYGDFLIYHKDQDNRSFEFQPLPLCSLTL